MHYNINTCNT